jgi:PTH1 family peptidyl-tRNA hydrolase
MHLKMFEERHRSGDSTQRSTASFPLFLTLQSHHRTYYTALDPQTLFQIHCTYKSFASSLFPLLGIIFPPQHKTIKSNRTMPSRKATPGAKKLSVQGFHEIPRSDDERYFSDETKESKPQKRNSRLARRQRSPSPSPASSLEFARLSFSDALETDMAALRRPLVIVSIGNPGKEYAQTFHNAGHLLARALTYRQIPSTWSLHQSKVYMNVSGPEVQKILRRAPNTSRLVVLHDDLEGALGAVRVKNGSASAQGHNGIKSIQQTLGKGREWWRVAVGVGRPVSRDAKAVADYVLSRIKGDDLAKIESAADKVIEELEKIDEG